MNKEDRLTTIMELLKVDKGSSVQALARLLDVSHMTVRRDLATLVEQGLVKIFHGSVILHPSVPTEGPEGRYSLIAAGAKHTDLKRRIGRLAASFIEKDDALIIDCGTTTEYLAKELPDSFPYTVLCYSFNIGSEVARRRNCRFLFSGGLFHENTLMFESPEGLEMIRNFRATKAFVSASGVSTEFGVTCLNLYERETKRTILRSSLRKILLVDSSKFSIVRSDRFADLADFDDIVTDEGIPPDTAKTIEEMGVRIHRA